MTNKYPNAEKPYRYRRRKPHTACLDRLGLPKATFATGQQANDHRHPHQEAYECPTGHGWHIRTKRGKQ